MPKDSQHAKFKPAPLPVARLSDGERLACLRLIRSENVGPVTFRELINLYGGAENALRALPEIARRAGGRRAPRICPVEKALAELEAAAAIGAAVIFTIEPGYPPMLAAVDVPPPALFVKGDCQLLAKPIVAIVGSRLASAAGHKFTGYLAAELGRAGLVIASGLARGIDAAAHRASLETGTVAVLAGGIDNIYPPEHADLQRAIGEVGCLVSEMPPGFKPRAQDFPRRNRIISGMSQAVVVIEAARRSGSLVTARLAAEQGRDVFAVPGHPLDPRAEGTNDLLKNGATLLTGPGDILEGLTPHPGFSERWAAELVTRAPKLELDPAGLPPSAGDTIERVLAVLGPAPTDIDAISRATGLEARAVNAALIELDLAGQIERHSHQLVSLIGLSDT